MLLRSCLCVCVCVCVSLCVLMCLYLCMCVVWRVFVEGLGRRVHMLARCQAAEKAAFFQYYLIITKCFTIITILLCCTCVRT